MLLQTVQTRARSLGDGLVRRPLTTFPSTWTVRLFACGGFFQIHGRTGASGKSFVQAFVRQASVLMLSAPRVFLFCFFLNGGSPKHGHPILIRYN